MLRLPLVEHSMCSVESGLKTNEHFILRHSTALHQQVGSSSMSPPYFHSLYAHSLFEARRPGGSGIAKHYQACVCV
jgi:hypothetical protein